MALALDPDGGSLYAATSSGVVRIDTGDPGSAPQPLFDEPGIRDIALTGDGIVTLSGDGLVSSWTLDGDPVASISVEGATDPRARG